TDYNFINVDRKGNAYLAGSHSSYTASNPDFTTVVAEYDSSGNGIGWTGLTDPPRSRQVATAMVVDESGNGFVTGYASNPKRVSQFETENDSIRVFVSKLTPD